MIARNTAACACPNYVPSPCLSFLLQCLKRGLCTGGMTATAIYRLQSFQQQSETFVQCRNHSCATRPRERQQSLFRFSDPQESLADQKWPLAKLPAAGRFPLWVVLLCDLLLWLSRVLDAKAWEANWSIGVQNSLPTCSCSLLL